MASDFGLKIGLEGEKEFKSPLRETNQQMKLLGSEMKLVQSQFGKNGKSAACFCLPELLEILIFIQPC